ncbi:MAG: lipoprotein [Bacteroidetes bacterium]|nr:lipoprotein [Fibrella sp.]
MKAFTNQSLFALVAVAMLSACSRPYATFQKTTPERFYTKTTPVAPAAVTPATEAVIVPTTDAGVIAPETPAAEVTAAEVVTPTTDVNAELQKVDALVSTKAGLSTNKKMTRHLARVKAMVTEIRANVAAPSSTGNVAPASVAPQKMNLMKRLVAKSMDKKIQNKLAPKKPMAKSLLTIGLIIGLIGLLLLLIGTGTVATLGYVGLIVGIVLVIASLI